MRRRLKIGLVQVYTGNGKGKSTAAFGLAVRAAGSGLKVLIIQFLKKGSFGEVKILRKIRNVTLLQYGAGPFVRGKPTSDDVCSANEGLLKAAEVSAAGKYDIIIMDEINVAMSMGMIDSAEVVRIVMTRPPNTEMVLTGRDCPSNVLAAADLVTEMKEVKHHFKRGHYCRRGIES